MPKHITKTSFKVGHIRSIESIEKQSATMKEQFSQGLRVNPRKPKGLTDTFDQRSCEHCQSIYAPTGSKQRWCKSCVPHGKARGMMTRYQLSWPEYLAAIAVPCPLCARPATVIDHDHTTGTRRSALCNGCNVALSRFEEDGWTVRARDYLGVKHSIC